MTWPAPVSMAVVVISGGLLVVAAVASLWSTPTDELGGARAQYDQLVCVEDQLRAQIPSGSRVYVRSSAEMRAADPTMPDISSSYWYQRLTELAYPALELVTVDDSPDYEVGIAEPFGTGGCGGVAVLVDER